ncbi:MAG: hypothetical protein AAGC53_01465 [Actinomycetota bacterium]
MVRNLEPVVDLELPVTALTEEKASALLESVLATAFGGAGVTRHRPNLLHASKARTRTATRTVGITWLFGLLPALWYSVRGAKRDFVGEFETKRSLDGLRLTTNGPMVAEQFEVAAGFVDRLGERELLDVDQVAAAHATLADC